MRIEANSIHTSLGDDGWRNVLVDCGIGEQFLRNKHGPCPICGGKDRFRFDNKRGRGDFYCNQCGSGDGFKLIMLTAGCTFSDAKKRVIDAAKMSFFGGSERLMEAAVQPATEVARPSARVIRLLRESCRIEDCEPAIRYLESRALWPLPAEHSLKAHPSVEYWHDRRRIGVFPAIVSAVRDINGELVTVHVTYLDADGRKISEYEPRKLLSGMTGRRGCAVRLAALAETLGIAEGIETALSATRLHGLPVWAALNTSLLAKFVPPGQVTKLVIFADRDVAGLDAASKLMQSLQGRVELQIRTPNLKDWNDSLRAPR